MKHPPEAMINIQVNTFGKNGLKLTWVLIIGGFSCIFGIFIEKSALKSRIHWIYCYTIYSFQSGVVFPAGEPA